MNPRFFSAALLICAPVPMLAHADIVSMGGYGYSSSQAATYSTDTGTIIPTSLFDNSIATTSDGPSFNNIDPLSPLFNGVTLLASTGNTNGIGTASASASLAPSVTLASDLFQVSHSLTIGGSSGGYSINGGTNSTSSAGTFSTTWFTVLSPVQYSLTGSFGGGSDVATTRWSLDIIGSSVNLSSCVGATVNVATSQGYCWTPPGAFSADGTLMPGEYQIQDALSGNGPCAVEGPGCSLVGGSSFSGAANYTLTLSAVPVPAALWLFGSGLIGLMGMARRKTA